MVVVVVVVVVIVVVVVVVVVVVEVVVVEVVAVVAVVAVVVVSFGNIKGEEKNWSGVALIRFLSKFSGIKDVDGSNYP